MNKIKKTSGLYLITIGIIIISIISCNNDDFVLGSEFLNSQTNIEVIDTFSVSLSTYIYDSIQTSGDSVLLVGNYNDTIFGGVTCNSVFQLGMPDYYNIGTEDIYDSICLLLFYNKYYYGDTTAKFNLTVHQLETELEANSDGKLYNTSKKDYNQLSLGTYNGKIYPNLLDSIYVPLNSEFGQEIFDLLYNEEDELTLSTDFTEYLKGLILVADDSYSYSVLGFDVSKSVLRMFMHHYEEFPVDETIDFPISPINLQYNQILKDFSISHYLSSLQSGKKEIKSTEVKGLSFMQGGIGMLQKVKFPSLPELLLYKEGSILKAELTVYPEKTSYSKFQLPKLLTAYKTDKYNNLLEPVYDNSGSIEVADVIIDEFYNETTSYTFDITNYIDNQLDNNYVDTAAGLMIYMLNNNYSSNLNRLVLSDSPKPPKLNIYFVTYP